MNNNFLNSIIIKFSKKKKKKKKKKKNFKKKKKKKKKTQQVRPYCACAILRNVTFDQFAYENFIELQDKLHNNICRLVLLYKNFIKNKKKKN